MIEENHCCCSVAKSGLTFCDPMDCNPQAPLSMGFPRQEYWSGLPFPSLGDLPDPGIKPTSPVLTGGFFTTESPGKPIYIHMYMQMTPPLWHKVKRN